MNPLLSKPTNRKQRERQILVFSLIGCALLVIAAFSWVYGPAYYAYWNYVPQEGDVLFQSLPHSRLVNAIEGVTKSPYSHCGMVMKQDGNWFVIEALHGVETTPLREFLFRGRNHGFAVYRLKSDCQQYVPATVENAKKYLGRPYDVRYRMDDERIYCSELIFKAYRESSGQSLGKLVRFGDLNWAPFEETIHYFEGGPVPLDREMITPHDLALAEQLELVFAHAIRAAAPE